MAKSPVTPLFFHNYAQNLDSLEQFPSTHNVTHSFALTEYEPIFCVKAMRRDIFPQNIDFQPFLAHMSGISLDVVKDARAHSQSSVLFCNAEAGDNQTFAAFLGGKQADSSRFQFDEITGKSEKSKCAALDDMKH